MAFLWGCYHQILGPRRHLPKFSNSLCRHAGACVRLNAHLGWQAAESYVERSNAFALIPGHRVSLIGWLLLAVSRMTSGRAVGTPVALCKLDN
jgi:hypothetical protein